ncbi:acylneuraminate cytidylyltransferase family protein [Lysinibacillus fusiformis]|uniref:acylneuraminate cytidylyltransferase family protein n=1 Tax=Lysinibacillus fusiformis TaxID=28031 RepID=UPI00263AD09E|nr:acylneuraminate cytidylyltransferase family protein [Lysinibacillus fusiformis]MDC6268318.1 acylneuraminate cytidylyltransferase family protein [Lysinibacillus sphaericus]MDN4969111.1 acylneuraminate cytidylyltransferase family protein [Lysinibacillus fusiformis]WRS99285.1 acylneuraminate cytidylyltransferase family protein [Lysinibacillus fusiformis]
MTRICTICARGGSKGVKNKNLLELLGKPLIAHSILQAKKSNLFDVIAVSSDSVEIIEVAKEYGADYVIKRPDELATDMAAKLPVIQHCVRQVEQLSRMKFDTMTDIDATSPLRTIEDLKNAVTMFEKNNYATNLISAAPARRSPYFNLIEEGTDGYVRLSKPLDKTIVRRQDAPKTYDMNASIYIWKRSSFFNEQSVFTEKTILYVMPEDRSQDIDSELDFEIVKLLAEKRGSLI